MAFIVASRLAGAITLPSDETVIEIIHSYTLTKQQPVDYLNFEHMREEEIYAQIVPGL